MAGSVTTPRAVMSSPAWEGFHLPALLSSVPSPLLVRPRAVWADGFGWNVLKDKAA